MGDSSDDPLPSQFFNFVAVPTPVISLPSNAARAPLSSQRSKLTFICFSFVSCNVAMLQIGFFGPAGHRLSTMTTMLRPPLSSLQQVSQALPCAPLSGPSYKFVETATVQPPMALRPIGPPQEPSAFGPMAQLGECCSSFVPYLIPPRRGISTNILTLGTKI